MAAIFNLCMFKWQTVQATSIGMSNGINGEHILAKSDALSRFSVFANWQCCE